MAVRRVRSVVLKSSVLRGSVGDAQRQRVQGVQGGEGMEGVREKKRAKAGASSGAFNLSGAMWARLH